MSKVILASQNNNKSPGFLYDLGIMILEILPGNELWKQGTIRQTKKILKQHGIEPLHKRLRFIADNIPVYHLDIVPNNVIINIQDDRITNVFLIDYGLISEFYNDTKQREAMYNNLVRQFDVNLRKKIIITYQ